jgi:hypothetical protein
MLEESTSVESKTRLKALARAPKIFIFLHVIPLMSWTIAEVMTVTETVVVTVYNNT